MTRYASSTGRRHVDAVRLAYLRGRRRPVAEQAHSGPACAIPIEAVPVGGLRRRGCGGWRRWWARTGFVLCGVAATTTATTTSAQERGEAHGRNCSPCV